MVAEMMAATMPLPKWIPSWGKSHAPINAPTSTWDVFETAAI